MYIQPNNTALSHSLLTYFNQRHALQLLRLSSTATSYSSHTNPQTVAHMAHENLWTFGNHNQQFLKVVGMANVIQLVALTARKHTDSAAALPLPQFHTQRFLTLTRYFSVPSPSIIQHILNMCLSILSMKCCPRTECTETLMSPHGFDLWILPQLV
jgi:hypothetical protein